MTTTETVKLAVKPLEWHGPDFEGEYWAASIAEKYVIHPPNGNGYWLGGVGGYFSSVSAAKAAAQADYEQRILSAIAPAGEVEPVADSAIDELCTELRLWHDCMDGSGPGDGRFRISDVPDPEQHRRNFRAALREAIKMIRALATPAPSGEAVPVAAEGWVLVPREPTDEQVSAGLESLAQSTGEPAAHIVRDAVYAYRAMIAAAPPSPLVEITEAMVEAAWRMLDGLAVVTHDDVRAALAAALSPNGRDAE